MISTIGNLATKLPATLNAEEPRWLPNVPNLLNLPHVEKTLWRGMQVYSLEEADRKSVV